MKQSWRASPALGLPTRWDWEALTLSGFAFIAIGSAKGNLFRPDRILSDRQPDADPFDLLCHLGFNAPLLTRRQRAERVKKQEAEFFALFGAEAREILTDLLEKYAADGERSFSLPDVLKVPPVSQHGNVNEIIAKFGDSDKLRNAVNQLQALLYTA